MINLALIGLGRWGKNIEATLKMIEGVDLVYTKNRDWSELLDKKDINAVLIATPPSTHAEIACAFLERGIPVFIEKPMALSVADAERIKIAAEEGQVIAFVGHIYLYNPAYQALKEAVKNSGKIKSIETKAGNKGPMREDYTVVWDYGPHDVSMILDLVGENPVSVQAEGTNDAAAITMNFANGLTTTSRVSRVLDSKQRQVEVTAGEDKIAFDDTLPENKVTVCHEGKITFPSYDEEKPLNRELKAFIDSINNKTKPVSDIEEGIRVIKILSSAEESIMNVAKEIFLIL